MQWMTIWKEDRGSTLVITALGMAVILGFVGLAIDVGNIRLAKRSLQSAADAAAVAAALEVTSCHGSANCSAMQTAAQTSLAENGYSGSALLTNCSGTAGAALTIMVNNPPCTQGTGDPNAGKQSYVEVIASQTKQTYFAGLVGYRSAPITVRAEAMKTPNPNCIYALDPSGGNALTVDLLASLSSACGIEDESSASNALSCNLLSLITASQINVVGGSQSFLCFPGTPANTGVSVPTPADPLAYLPKPSVLPCGSSTTSPYHGASGPITVSGTATLYPDASYCGGITIALASNVTFMPGTYVIKSVGSQGGLTISLLANVNGTGVTFYNYGPNGGITFLAASVNLGVVNLVAPTSGTYAGILFFQDPQDTAGATILGSTSWNTVLEGAYYLPSAKVTFAASLSVHYNFLVAKDIEFAVLTFASSQGSTFGKDYSTLSNGSPLAGGGSVLVQ